MFSAKLVKTGRIFHLELRGDLFRIPLPTSNQLTQILLFLLHHPLVDRHAERIAEFADKTTLAHLGMACKIFHAFHISVIADYECPQVVRRPQDRLKESGQLFITIGVSHIHQQVVLF